MPSITKTTGSITTEHEGFTEEERLFTHSEDERQQNQINAANASHVFSPKFIPVYPQLLKDGLTLTEALIFGFIDFYKSSSSARFYFTNEQIASIAGCSPDTVSRCISSLEKKGLIKTSKKMRAGGGLIRFVTDILSVTKSTKYQFGNRQNLQTNKNKIKENKINTTNVVQKVEYGNGDINLLMEALKSTFNLPLLDGTQEENRRYAYLCIQKFGGVEKVTLLIKAARQNRYWGNKIASFKKLYYNGVSIIAETQKGGSGNGIAVIGKDGQVYYSGQVA